MYFNRFDIVEAYYMYMVLWNRDGLTRRDAGKSNSISVQLHNVKFRPSPLMGDENDLDENAREIYDGLVEKYEKGAN